MRSKQLAIGLIGCTSVVIGTGPAEVQIGGVHEDEYLSGLGAGAEVRAVLAIEDPATVKFEDVPAVYAAGVFPGAPDGALIRWDGSDWGPVGPGIDPASIVHDMAVFRGDLYVGGQILLTIGSPISGVAKWDGKSWTEVAMIAGFSREVLDLLVYDDGSGEKLYACGDFQVLGGMVGESRISAYDGSSWERVHGSVWGDQFVVAALVGFEGKVHFGGGFSTVSDEDGFGTGVEALLGFVDRTGGAPTLRPVVGGVLAGGDARIRALVVYRGELWAGGDFTTVNDGLQANGLAKWNRERPRFEPPASNLEAGAEVHTLGVFDDGDRSLLIAGGRFTRSAGGTMLHSIGAFDGASWSALERGESGSGVVQDVSYVIFRLGAGP